MGAVTTTNVLACLVRYLGIVLPVVAVLLAIRFLLHPPREVFRKMLHAVAFVSTPVFMHLAGSWQLTVVSLVTLGVVVWPILVAIERFPWYSDLFIERRGHEVRRSLLILFWGDAAVVALCWGAFGRPDVAIASILMWGFGDAAAALVGKRFGTHHVRLPLADHKKTWEGSSAMLVVSMLIGLLVMGPRLAVPIAAIVGTYVELITHGGNDTITVPVANALTLLLLA